MIYEWKSSFYNVFEIAEQLNRLEAEGWKVELLIPDGKRTDYNMLWVLLKRPNPVPDHEF